MVHSNWTLNFICFIVNFKLLKNKGQYVNFTKILIAPNEGAVYHVFAAVSYTLFLKNQQILFDYN